jgi:hypothetical protein
MHATPLLVALLTASIAGPSLAQNAQYPPWPPPEAQSSYDPYGPPPEPPPPPPGYDERTDRYAAQPEANSPYADQPQGAAYTAQPGPPEPPQPDYAPYADQPQSAPNAAQLGAPPSPQLVTPAQEGAKSLTTAASAPLHEMNLVGQKIPPVLLAALADPYAYPAALTCDSLANEVDNLTVALGPDFDNLPPPEKKKVAGSGGLGLQLANSAAGSLLPFHGYIGYLTGATKRDQLIMRALNAGSSRRAYLKGLGEAQRCPSPASPHHLAWAAAPVYDGPRRPQYPIR